MSDYQQNRVSKTTWPWVEETAATAPKPPATRGRAALQFCLMLVIAVFIRWKFDKQVLPLIIVALATFVLVSGLFFPAVFLAVDGVMRAFGRVVGTALTWILLVPFFFICFVPARIILRLRGSDPMKRVFPSDEATHWVPHAGRRDLSHYRKQF